MKWPKLFGGMIKDKKIKALVETTHMDSNGHVAYADSRFEYISPADIVGKSEIEIPIIEYIRSTSPELNRKYGENVVARLNRKSVDGSHDTVTLRRVDGGSYDETLLYETLLYEGCIAYPADTSNVDKDLKRLEEFVKSMSLSDESRPCENCGKDVSDDYVYWRYREPNLEWFFCEGCRDAADISNLRMRNLGWTIQEGAGSRRGTPVTSESLDRDLERLTRFVNETI